MARSSKRRSSRAKKTGPTIGDLIVDAVSASKERSGVSLPTLKKLLAAKGYDVKKNKARIKTAIKNLVTKGTLVQVKGSFKMGKKGAKPKPKPRKPVKRAKKPAAKKRPSGRKRRSARRSKKTKKAAKRPRKSAKRPRKTSKKRASKRTSRKASLKKK